LERVGPASFALELTTDPRLTGADQSEYRGSAVRDDGVLIRTHIVAITARPVAAARKFVPEPFIQNPPLSTNATSGANLAHGHKMRNQESGFRNQESGFSRNGGFRNQP